jgi:quercetin dioxygenase-like cupin family protein
MVRIPFICSMLIAASFCASGPYAQQGEPIKRTLLQRGDFPGDKMATQLMLIEIVPNGVVARHTHPGGEVGYVLEGTIEFTMGEGPPKVFRQGDTYMIPVNTAHIAKAGPAGAKLVGTFVVEKDKPLASPAP